MGSYRAWRLDRLRLQLADLEYRCVKFGSHFRPSERAYVDRQAERLERKIERLEGRTDG